MDEGKQTKGQDKEEGIVRSTPAMTMEKCKRKLSLGGMGNNPKKTKVVTTPSSP